MEVIELTKDLFQGAEVRIFGTTDDPLFVAADLAKILDIKNIHETISKFDEDEKSVLLIPDRDNKLRKTILLTDSGLYRLILKSNKPVAKEFGNWIFKKLLPSIRKTGKYDIRDHIDEQKDRLERELEETRSECDTLRANIKPEIEYHPIDQNDFAEKSCVYLIRVDKDYYKFGVSSGIDGRIGTHTRNFTKLGYVPKLVHLWICNSAHIMKSVEKKIKKFALQNNIISTFHGHTEIIKTYPIEPVVAIITKYVEDYNSADLLTCQNEHLKLEIELKKADTENKKADIELGKIGHYELQNKYLELQIQFQQLKLGKAIQSPPKILFREDNANMSQTSDNILIDSRPIEVRMNNCTKTLSRKISIIGTKIEYKAPIIEAKIEQKIPIIEVKIEDKMPAVEEVIDTVPIVGPPNLAALKETLVAHNIGIHIDDNNKLWFNLRDVGTKIGDKNFARNKVANEDKMEINSPTQTGKILNTPFVSEVGIECYLKRSKKHDAPIILQFIIDEIKKVRDGAAI